MKCSVWLLGLFGLLAIASLAADSAHAQTNSISWVSATGSDANPCTYASPCLSFFGAIPKTRAGGEIHCANSLAAHANFTIDKTITIDCAGEMGAITPGNSGGAIFINAKPSDKVILRNLTINNFDGAVGIWFVAGGELEVDNVKFQGANTAGIFGERTTTGVIIVKNSTFSRMPTGIKVQTTSGNIFLSVTNSSFNYLLANGVEAGPNVSAGVYNSTFTFLNGTAILANAATSTIYAQNNVIEKTWVGISAAVSGAKINAKGNSLYGSGKAFNVAAGAAFLSGGDNRFDINPGEPATGALGTK